MAGGFWSSYLNQVVLGLVFASTAQAAEPGSQQSQPLPGSVHQDWSGILLQTTLPDRSVLNEYTARTYSGSTPGASLQVSFAPRFDCTAMVSVVVAADVGQLGEEQFSDEQSRIVMQIDSDTMDVPTLTDREERQSRYSYDADSASQQLLRTVLDTASRVEVELPSVRSVSPDADAADPPPVKVLFSLLGSRMTIQSVENRCRIHEPLPFSD